MGLIGVSVIQDHFTRPRSLRTYTLYMKNVMSTMFQKLLIFNTKFSEDHFREVKFIQILCLIYSLAVANEVGKDISLTLFLLLSAPHPAVFCFVFCCFFHGSQKLLKG
jgi:hypothetical protein